MPPWHPDDNFDNVRKRTINAAWHLLLTRDINDISFRQLANASDVTPQAIYHHFKRLDVLAAELAALSWIKLRSECNTALGRTKSVSRCIRAILEFARKRPNHFTLITSGRLSGWPRVEKARRALYETLEVFLHRLLRREPTREEVAAIRVQVLGGATMVAARMATVDEVLTTLVAAIRSWSNANRRGRAA